jgi:hypothetical protein
MFNSYGPRKDSTEGSNVVIIFYLWGLTEQRYIGQRKRYVSDCWLRRESPPSEWWTISENKYAIFIKSYLKNNLKEFCWKLFGLTFAV